MDALYIKKGFTDYLDKKLGKNPKFSEQRAFLLNHPRRHIAETNVQKEIKQCSLKWGAKFQKPHVDKLIEAGASIFFDCAIAAKTKELLTEAELARLRQKDGELADTQLMVDEMEREANSTAVTKSMAVPSAQQTGKDLGGSKD